jgi:membrane protease YdiL (CAAX protease family)
MDAARPPRLDVSSSGPTLPGALALAAAGGVVLAGYFAGRTSFERLGAWLAAEGVGAGVAAIAPLPVYVGLVLAGIGVAIRLAGPAADPRPALRLFSSARSTGAGLIVGAALVAAAYAVAVLAGWATMGITFPTAHLASALAGYAILYAGIACSEELVFRGTLLGLLGRWAGVWPAVILTSALFAMAHLGASVTWARLLGVFLLGVLLALLRLRARSLWPAIAAHWSFHFLSYAAALGLPPLRVALTGPLALVGTADQLDAGLLTIAALAIAVACALAGQRRSLATWRPSS